MELFEPGRSEPVVWIHHRQGVVGRANRFLEGGAVEGPVSRQLEILKRSPNVGCSTGLHQVVRDFGGTLLARPLVRAFDRIGDREVESLAAEEGQA